jgi:hypothetical protein
MPNHTYRQCRQIVSDHSFRLALLCLLALPMELASQSVLAVPPGSRVRISVEDTVPTGPTVHVIGTLVSMSSESVVIRNSADSPQSFPAASVTAVEVSTGRTSKALQGAWIGALGLGTISAIQSYIEESRCEPPVFGGGPFDGCGSPGAFAVLGFIVGGVVGGGAGALVGSLIRTDRWLEVSPSVPSAVGPSSGGLAISISFAH